MALPYPIAASQTDAKSPVDDNLMDSIRLDLEYLDSAIISGGQAVYPWSINGVLTNFTIFGGIAKRIDMQFVHLTQTFTRCRLAQEVSGTSGVTEIDIRYHSTPKTPIISITPQHQQNTQSVSQLGAALSTQAVTNSTPAISTQSISRAKTQLNVQSIINVPGTNLWRYNLNAAPDSDYAIGDTFTAASCTNPANNGSFTIVEINQSGYPSLVVTNASGVAQTGAAGTIDLDLWSYNQTNPVNSHFAAGEEIILASHTSANNNGTKTIYAINQGGNNIWVKNSLGVLQPGVAGTCTCTRWTYTYLAAVDSDFAVGEKARFASHTSGVNNGDFTIRAVNSGGNNIVVTNNSGAAQAGVAGNATRLRWKYVFPLNPSADVSVGHSMVFASHTSGNNNGTFTILKVNDTTNDNVVIYNASGVAQAGVAGTVTHTRKIVAFSSDQSAVYSSAAPSYVELEDCPDSDYNMSPDTLPFKVLEVNRGGGSNFNIVIDVELGSTQSSPAGFVAIEGRSIFTAADGSKPQLAVDMIGLTNGGLLKDEFTQAAGEISAVAVPALTYMGLYILQIQDGYPANLSVILN